MPAIPLHQRLLIIQLNQRGDSQRKIAHDVGVSKGAVQHILEKHRKGLEVKNKSKWCTPCKLSQRQKNKIIIQSKKDSFLTANQVRRSCNLEDVVSVSTVKRVLRSAQLFGRVASKKPFLDKKLSRRRMTWCSEKQGWEAVDWQKVIFTDESKIELMPRRRQYVRRKKNQQLLPHNIIKTKKFSPYVMIWGAIRYDGKRFIKRIVGTLDSLGYQRILDEAIPWIYSTRYVLQQDGASCHTSHSTMNYIRTKAIRMLQNWPPQSADLSPIENLWDFLKERVMDRKPTNVDELWTYTREEFHLIPLEYIQKLFDSMPRRIAAVREAKGGYTKY